MFTVFRNTSKPAHKKPERESKRGMTKQVEGYRLESAKFFVCPSKVCRFDSSLTTGPLVGRIPLRCSFSPICFSQAIEILLFHLLLSYKSSFPGYGQFLAIAIEKRRHGNKGLFSTAFSTVSVENCG